MTKDLPSQLWAPRSIDDTLQLYADWADSYEADVNAYGYVTPDRVAQMLSAHVPDKTLPILDFGCGTGLSGVALAKAGFTTIDGTDISDEMRAKASGKGVYRKVFAGVVGEVPDALAGTYASITAIGVVSLGAAPPEMLRPLLDLLKPGGHLAFSYNDATLLSADYMNALAEVQASGNARMLAAAYGPHLPEKDGARGSVVYCLQRL